MPKCRVSKHPLTLRCVTITRFICIADDDFNCLSFCRSSACQGHKYPPTSANSHIKYAWSRKFSQTITVHPNPPQSYNQFIRAKHFRYTDIVKARYPQYFCPSNNKDAESNLNRVRILYVLDWVCILYAWGYLRCISLCLDRK